MFGVQRGGSDVCVLLVKISLEKSDEIEKNERTANNLYGGKCDGDYARNNHYFISPCLH